MTSRVSAVLFVFLTSFASSLIAQEDPLGWNSSRALELIERARVRRDLPRGDSTLRNYTAKANGFVYFYLDRQETDERTLVKVDQIALDLFWRAPDRTKQRIVGLRDASRLPNKMYYHLDHLTVVQNGFGDVIKIGDGDEVRDVPHPAATGADTIYDFRLADSVTLTLGAQGTVRVYEIQVRPKRVNRSALIGSVFVDRASADIVRMTFTFTPASYVDRRLDYINISLDNALFAGSYWLPAEQSVEIRRQIPELDFAAGAVIKGRMRINRYEFNQPLADSVFHGRTVSAAPEAQRLSYPFEQDIYAGVNEEGLEPTARMEELQDLAVELVGRSKLSGLPPFRVYMPDASSFVRFNRVEGWYTGLGATYVASPSVRVDALGGFAFGPEHGAGLLQTRIDPVEGTRIYVGVEANSVRDIGPITGLPGVLNTVAGRLFHDDYLDPYYVDAMTLRIEQRIAPRWLFHVRTAVEDHNSAVLTQDADEFRPVRAIDPGRVYVGGIGLQRVLPITSGWRFGGSVDADIVRFDGGIDIDIVLPDKTLVRPRLDLQAHYDNEAKTTSVLVQLRGGTTMRHDAPPQYQVLLGGRETIPGYGYRVFGGNAYALAQVEASRVVWQPWVRMRAFASAGYTEYSPDMQAYRELAPETDGVKLGGGIGVGLFWDILRFDFARVDDWRLIFSVQPKLRDLL